MTRSQSTPDVDAIVIGAGFGGIYMCKKLLDQGLSVRVIEAAPDVGGTWYWNRYPGALSDTRSFLYRYSWDLDDLREYPWAREYLTQPEILAYLQHVVERHKLRPHMQFNTEMHAATFHPDHNTWTVSLSSGAELTAQYLITAVGLLSKINYPDIPGIDTFQGETYHTARWPSSYDFTNKRVGVIGSGSTGVQLITAVADQPIQQLLSFQRHPQYVVPAGDEPVSPSTRQSLNAQWPSIWSAAKNSTFGFGFPESTTPALSVSAETRAQIFESAWKSGGGFNFMFGTFSDITTNRAANRAAADFIRHKIRTTVTDPRKAQLLCPDPSDLYARRPLCDTGYYEKFNRPNVDIIDIQQSPITTIIETGLRTADGTAYPLDVLIFATGFDAVDGNYKRVSIKGTAPQALHEQWRDAGQPSSYLGVSFPGFPNLFSVMGPNSPFTNQPPLIEIQVEFIADLIAHAHAQATQGPSSSPNDEQGQGSGPGPHPQAKGKGPRVEAEPSARDDWMEQCDRLSAPSLFRQTKSWIFGHNVPGKATSVLFYFGGLVDYRNVLQGIVQSGYKNFRFS